MSKAPMLRHAATLLISLTCSAFTPTLFAASVQLFEHSTSSVATAAANQAEAMDASAMFWNPANLTRLQDSNISAALHFLEPTGKLADLSGTADTSGAPLRGSDGGSAGIFSPAASFYYTKAFSKDTTLGFAMTAPFGLALTYEDNWVGRYHALESEILTVDLGLSIGHRVNPTLSVGFGVDVQYVKTTLGNAIDLSAICQAIGSGQCAGSGFDTQGNVATDGRVTVKQDDWTPGWNAGVLWEPTPHARFGFAFRSKVNHEVKGTASFVKPANTPSDVNDLAGVNNSRTRTDLPLPASASLSAFYQIDPEWAVMGAATWTHWSKNKELRTRFDNGAPDSVLQLDWKNAWRVGVGMNYKPSSTLTLRAGLAYDQTPTSSPQRQTLLIPDADRMVFALGSSFAYSKNLSLEFGATRYEFKNLPIQQSGANQGTVNTRYPSAGITVFSLQSNYRF